MKFTKKNIQLLALKSCQITLLIGVVFSSSCRKFTVIPAPQNSINAANVFTNDATAISAVTSFYALLSSHELENSTDMMSAPLYCGLTGDELVLFSGATSNNTFVQYYSNNINESRDFNFWPLLYSYIYNANSAIEGLNASGSLTPVVKKQLLGEAKFFRAFAYFYLVNLYGDIPLITTTDYKINSLKARTSRSEIYNQIISDLTDAELLLSDKYLNSTLLKSTTDKIRLTKWASAALLARAYLYNSKWAEAEQQATLVINSGIYRLGNLTANDYVFSKNSPEAIWQLQPVIFGWNSQSAQIFSLTTGGPDLSHPVFLSDQQLQAFEVGDQRKVNWVDSVTVSGATYYFPSKYKISAVPSAVTEYEMIFRLGEQYLIRAEARAKLGANLNGALDDINQIRIRAGLPGNTLSTQADLLLSIEHERQVELFTESGHRWFDLKRTGKIDDVMKLVSPKKGGQWSSYKQYFPIPLRELQLNPNLVQNPGY